VNLQGPFFGGKGYYRVCVVNGYVASKGVSYKGSVTLNALARVCGGTYTPRPTSVPSVKPTAINSIADTSSVDNVVANTFNLNLAGGFEDCITVQASGGLTQVSASVFFQPTTGSDSYASDFYITIEASGASGCIQVGGYDINYCTDAYSWPISWGYGTTNTYTASIAISNSEYLKLGATSYEICYGNGQATSPNVGYSGQSRFVGLTSSTVNPSDSGSSDGKSTTVTLAVVIPLVILFVAGGVYWFFYMRKGSKPSATKSSLASPYAAYEDNEEAVAPRGGNSAGSYSSQGVITNPLLQKG